MQGARRPWIHYVAMEAAESRQEPASSHHCRRWEPLPAGVGPKRQVIPPKLSAAVGLQMPDAAALARRTVMCCVLAAARQTADRYQCLCQARRL